MSSKMDKAATGVSFIARIVVSLLWLAGGIACFAAGLWYFGLLAVAYLAYLWVLGGRWLIY